MHRLDSDPIRSTTRFAAGAFAALVVGLFASQAAAFDVESAGVRQDATLRDVAFLNADDGFAVGDGGTILRTEDGGASWAEVAVDSTATFTGVAFVDRQRGLVVGWKLSPYTHRASAEVFSTSDGGATWLRQTNGSHTPTAEAARLLPGFLGIVSTSEDLAAFGFPNLHARTGLAPWSGPALGFRREGLDRRAPIVAAARAPAGTWLFADPTGEVSRLRSSGFESVKFPGSASPAVRALAADGTLVVAAGSDGFAAVSDDSGQTFRNVEPLAPPTHRFVHWKTAAVSGDSIWLAGTPGSIVARSNDRGATWKLSPQADPASVEKLFFLDRGRGWAVGEFGVVRRTLDGGETWTATRGAGRAAALATFSTTPQQAPIAAIAKHATVDGYRVANYVLADVDDEAAWSNPTAGMRLAFATGQCGGGSVTNLLGRTLRPGALEDPAAIFAQSSRTGCASEAEATDRLAAWIRASRPEVLLIPSPSLLGGAPADDRTHRLAVAAVEKAADPAFAYAPMQALSLPAWQTKRVAAMTNSPDASLRVDGNVYVSAARLSAVEFVLERDAYLRRDPTESWNATVRFAEVRRTLPRAGANDLFADLSAAAGGARRRERTAPAPERLREHQEAIPWRRSFETLAHPDMGDDETFEARLDDVMRRTATFDAAAAGAAVHSIACLAGARGRDDLAGAAWRMIVDRDPYGPYAEYACLRLAGRSGSAEILAWDAQATARRAEEAKKRSPTALAGVESFALPKPASDPNGDSVRKDDIEYRAVPINPGAVAFGPVPTAVVDKIRAVETGALPTDLDERPGDWTMRLEAIAPWSLAWSRTQFMAWCVERRSGAASALDNDAAMLSAALPTQLSRFVAFDLAGPAAQEIPLRRCDRKPYLDGILVDETWNGGGIVAADSGERLAIAFDDDHLFVAYRAPDGSVNATDTNRSNRSPRRDASLFGNERLTIVIDVDGDATSALRFEIDRFGRCAESVGEERRWNPKWYAAAGDDPRAWSVEAAIPRTSDWAGSGRPPVVSAIGVYRVVPGVGIYDVLAGEFAEDFTLPTRRTRWVEAPDVPPATDSDAIEPVKGEPTFDAASLESLDLN